MTQAPDRLHAVGPGPHRPEIDGLRALAVLPVMLFHAGIGGFGGGYVGVDVFFVISGFLITSMVVSGLRTGSFSLRDFYERRARRLLPALFVVMAACLPAAWFLLLPGEALAFGRSMAAASAFGANMLFWRTSGYFDQAAELKPLLHTWSLGVEEQFYIVFPLLLMLCWRLSPRRLALLLGAMALLSLAGAQWLLARQPQASFYLAPWRAWELLSGALLALHCGGGLHWPAASRWPAWQRDLAGACGLALILLPVLTYTPQTPFPGLAALPPVLGTLLVLACVDGAGRVGRLLTWRPVVGIGLISYSAYLWHQPLLAFARLSQPGAAPDWLPPLMVLLALGLAAVTWRLVELPWRDRHRQPSRAVWRLALAGTLGLGAAGLALGWQGGLPQRWPPAVRDLIDPPKTRLLVCPPASGGLQICPLGAPGRPVSVVLLGDSHANALHTALDARLARDGLGGALVQTACHPIPAVFDSRESNTAARQAACGDAHRQLLAYVARPEVRQVLLAIRWTARLAPMTAGELPWFDNGEGGVEMDFPFRRNLAADSTGRLVDAPGPKAAAVTRYLQQLAALKPTVVLDPVPEVGWSPSRLNLLGWLTEGATPALISTATAQYQRRHAATLALLAAAEGPRLQRSRPQDLLCDRLVPGRCVAQQGSALYYFNDDHLSMLGAGLVVDDMLARGSAGR